MLKLFRRIRYFLRQRRIDRELAQELELHRAMEAERLERAGLDPATARSASRRAMGNDARARGRAKRLGRAVARESRPRHHVRVPGDGSPSSLRGRHDSRDGRRIGATTGVFGLLDRLVLQSLPVHEPDRLVFLRNPGGRDFTDRDTSASTRVVLINESLARKIAGVGDPHRSKNHDRPQPIT